MSGNQDNSIPSSSAHSALRKPPTQEDRPYKENVELVAKPSVPLNPNHQTSSFQLISAASVDVKALDEIVAGYVTRSLHEDLEKIIQIGGVEHIINELKTDVLSGIKEGDEADLVWRTKMFGPNRLPSKKRTPFWRLLYDASADFMLRILIVAAIVSLTLSVAFGDRPEVEWIEGAAILLAVVIVMLVTAGNDWFKERQFAQLYAQEEKFCNVIRGGAVRSLNAKSIAVGDILSVEAGDEVPADCLVVKALNVRIDESSLTGESDLIQKETFENCLAIMETKSEEIEAARTAMAAGTGGGRVHHLVPSPVVMSGSVVSSGAAYLLVIAVGIRSQVGKLFTKLTVDTEPTPLQNKLNALARDVGKFGFISACMVLAAMIIEFGIMYALDDPSERPSGPEIAEIIVGAIVTSITIIVVAVPEGLPLAVTISLAFSVNRMLKDQNYVRRLAACETMGGANEICSDKTGTLTKNQMEVEALWNGSNLFNSMNEIKSAELLLPPQYMTILVENIAINSTGHLEFSQVEIKDGSKRTKDQVKQVGSPTECALLQFITSLGYDYNQLRRTCSPIDGSVDQIVFKIPFSSDRKMMSTVVYHPTQSDLYRIYVKGASEVVLRRCGSRIDSSGNIKELNPQRIARIEEQVVHQLASQALRTIAIAYRDFSPNDFSEWAEVDDSGRFHAIENDLTCLAITGIRDPVREEVPAAVRKCQSAGIKVRMCTGDNIETAKQIALTCNIYHPENNGIAMQGPDFYKLVGGVVCETCRTEVCDCNRVADDDANDAGGDEEEGNAEPEEKRHKWSRKKGKVEKKKKGRNDVLGNPEAFEKIAEKLEVLARSQPNDKYALVTGLRNRGAVVAVTGDGVNDAPALKKADVGFAMGITGKEVAKQAADIVLLDDNFESIVKAVKWGRNIFDNIRKFLQFQLTVNGVAVTTAFVGAVVLQESPLSAVQMLWVNLIMDTFGALALATEQPREELLQRPPHSRKEYLISKTMWRNIIAQVIYQVAVMFVVIFCGECWLPEYQFYVSEENLEKYPDYTEFSMTCGNGHTVRSGRHYFPFSDREDYKSAWTNNIGSSRHFTYVFNIFVFMQIFNLINARRIGPKEFGVLTGLFTNKFWIVIFLIIIVGQVLMVEFGSFALSCHPDGLTWQQWLISVALGFGTLIVGFLVKLLPSMVVELLPETGDREVNLMDEPPSLALASRGRISSGRISQRLVLTESGKLHPALASHPAYSLYVKRRTIDPNSIHIIAEASSRGRFQVDPGHRGADPYLSSMGRKESSGSGGANDAIIIETGHGQSLEISVIDTLSH